MPEKIKNLRRVRRKLEQLKRDPALVLKPMLEEAAMIVTSEQKRLCPVLTGALRESIQWSFDRPPKGVLGAGAAKFAPEGELNVFVTAGNRKVRYAAFVEHGTKDTPKQPFFFSGYRAVKAEIKALASQRLLDAVKSSVE